MKREQLLRQLCKDARLLVGNCSWTWLAAKASHCVVRFKGSFSVIKSGEITPLMEKIIRKQLGL